MCELGEKAGQEGGSSLLDVEYILGEKMPPYITDLGKGQENLGFSLEAFLIVHHGLDMVPVTSLSINFPM